MTVVNRYQKDSGITTEDIRTTLGCGELSLVPNDFRTRVRYAWTRTARRCCITPPVPPSPAQ